MCGRYVRRSDKQRIAEHFHANPTPPDLPMPAADYNVAPTTQQPIIRQSLETGERACVDFPNKGMKRLLSQGSFNAATPLRCLGDEPLWRATNGQTGFLGSRG